MKLCTLLNGARLLLAIGGLALTPSFANATSLILDGDFLDSIGTGLNLTPWSDWTSAGITRHPAPLGIPGNYASLPVGADLFQRFSPLPNGSYALSFQVQNQSPWASQLVFAVQQGGGTPASTLLSYGTLEDLSLPESSSFLTETFDFNINNPPFTPNELTFSNSYDSTVPPVGVPGSKNSAGTIINIADVSLLPIPGISAFLGSGPNFGAFNSNVVGATNGTTDTLWGAATYSTSGGNPQGQVRDDSSTDVYLQPDNDPTHYLFAAGGGTATVTWGHDLNSFTFYWGSIDSYNTLTLSNGDSITGAALASELGIVFDGNGNSNVSRWITIFDPTPFDSFMASSSQAAFEFDMAAVPEASTWAMMLLGFAGLGYAGCRHQRLSVGVPT